MIFPPVHLGGVGRKVRAGDMVVGAQFGPTETAKEALGLVGAALAVAVDLGVVDPLGEVAGVQLVPMGGFVGVDRAAEGHALLDGRNGGVFGLGDEGQGLAVALAGDDHHPTLAVLIAAETAIPPVFFPVGGLHVAAEIGAINLYLAGHHGTDVLSRHRLAQLMGQDEGRFVLDVQIAAQLEGGNALGAVAEDGDGQQVIPHLQFATSEDGSAGGAELVAAALALPQAAGGVGIDGQAGAARATGFPCAVRPTDLAERFVSFLIAHAHDRFQRKRLGG